MGGKPVHAFYAIVYPLMLETGVVWVMTGAVGILSDQIAADPKLQACVIPEPKEESNVPAAAGLRKLMPETVRVPLIRDGARAQAVARNV